MILQSLAFQKALQKLKKINFLNVNEHTTLCKMNLIDDSGTAQQFYKWNKTCFYKAMQLMIIDKQLSKNFERRQQFGKEQELKQKV